MTPPHVVRVFPWIPLRASLPALLPLMAALTLSGGCEGELPPQQPTRTVRLVAGRAALVGSEGTGCSYGVAGGKGAATPERWCAFYRPTADGSATELLAINIDRAGRRPVPTACDGSDPSCVLLTATLWTGEPVFSPSHPWVHGFEGDTLVFYADSTTSGKDDGYVGPIRGWRPGMSAARQLSGSRGLVCLGHLRSDGVLCVENQATTPAGLEFDLLAGSMATSTTGGAAGPLPLIERIRPYDMRGSLMWQVAFSPSGEHLAFSTRAPAPDLAVERLRLVPTAQIGTAVPAEVLRDIARWQFSPDGTRIFFLRNYNYLADRDATGDLYVADFPAFVSVKPLATRVSRFQVHGDPDGQNLSLSLFQDVSDTYGNFRFMPDVSKPEQMVTVGRMIEDARVSPDRRYSFFYDFDAEGDTISVLARNDGSGSCVLNAKKGHVAFGVRFARTGGLVFWGEDSMEDPAHNEAWFADAASCAPKIQFSNRIAYLESTRAGALFGEEEGTATTMNLRHARLGTPGPAGEPRLAIDDLATGADTSVALVDERYVIYTVNQGDPGLQGLYLHGPLP